MPDKTCKTCKHWSKSRLPGSKTIVCNNGKISSWAEGPDTANVEEFFIPGPDFGCIHHEPKEDAR